MKKELIGKTKEERKLVFDSLLFFAVLIALVVFTFTKCNIAYNHAISQKQITTSVDGQGVK